MENPTGEKITEPRIKIPLELKNSKYLKILHEKSWKLGVENPVAKNSYRKISQQNFPEKIPVVQNPIDSIFFFGRKSLQKNSCSQKYSQKKKKFKKNEENVLSRKSVWIKFPSGENLY